jgi:hypothetical protein
MGWFTAKQTSEPMDPARGTISDKEWRALQARALKANPARRETFSKEATEKRKAASEQYRKRGQS